MRINLYLSIRDAFLDPPEWVVCLHGRVAPHRVSFDDAESFWEEDDLINNGLEALLKHGLDWFETFGNDAEVLAAWLEKAIDERTSVGELIEPPVSAHAEIERMIAPYLKGRIRSAPMNYELFLSLLKLTKGNLMLHAVMHSCICRALTEAVLSFQMNRSAH